VKRWTIILAARGSETSLDSWLTAANALSDPRVGSSVAAGAAPDRVGAGEVIWTLVLDSDTTPGGVPVVAALLDDAHPITVIDEVEPQPIAARITSMAGPRVLRTLLIRVRPGTPSDLVSGFESALVAMPDHIASIRSWQLSRVDPERHGDGWTHLWEQEFDDAAGFRPYMAHPFHWTGIERWFDPEIPGHIVEEEAHYLSAAPGAILGD
jgi:Stress responsive A/B Barrel Domain